MFCQIARISTVWIEDKFLTCDFGGYFLGFQTNERNCSSVLKKFHLKDLVYVRNYRVYLTDSFADFSLITC